MGTNAYPLFIVSYNNEQTHSQGFRTHIQRHEIGHALNLGDTNHQCWSFNSPIYPLMRNSAFTIDGQTCPSYPSNITATPNEAAYAKSRSGW